MNVLDTLACEVVSCAEFAGNRPFAKVEPWGVQALYFNANGSDAIFEAEHEDIAAECERRGIAFCIWFNVWRNGTDGRAFAQSCSRLVDRFGGMKRVRAVMFDNEKVPLAFQDQYMTRWDQLRPYRPTLYSVEPFQDESQNRYVSMLMRPPSTRKVTFQCYYGGMQPLPPLAVRTSQFGVARVADGDLMPTIDPEQPASYIASASACGLRGLMLFEAGRIPEHVANEIGTTAEAGAFL